MQIFYYGVLIFYCVFSVAIFSVLLNYFYACILMYTQTNSRIFIYVCLSLYFDCSNNEFLNLSHSKNNKNKQYFKAYLASYWKI